MSIGDLLVIIAASCALTAIVMWAWGAVFNPERRRQHKIERAIVRLDVALDEIKRLYAEDMRQTAKRYRR